MGNLESLHRYFFPAATTRARNTGLPTTRSVPPNGLITALSHTSNTSLKNSRIASSVAGLVGLFAMEVLPVAEDVEDEEERLLPPPTEGTVPGKVLL